MPELFSTKGTRFTVKELSAVEYVLSCCVDNMVYETYNQMYNDAGDILISMDKHSYMALRRAWNKLNSIGTM